MNAHRLYASPCSFFAHLGFFSINVLVVIGLCSNSEAHAQAGTAWVRHAPSVNGTVEGSVQLMTAESLALNGGSLVTEDLLVPGIPAIKLNGKPTYAGTLDGTGSPTPSNYQITINGGGVLRNIIRRTDPISLPALNFPPQPTATRSVTINSSGESAGSFSTLRNLTLNGNAGQLAIPAGTYGDFTANSGSGFILGVAGATQPSVYNFQRLTFNGQSQLQVVGPVVVTVANGLTGNGGMGSTDHPDWLALNIAAGGLTLNGGCTLYAFVDAPSTSGTVIINGNSTLVGGLIADRLIINGGGQLRLRQGGGSGPANTAPVAANQSLTLAEDSSLAVTLAASDAENDPLTYALVTPPAHGTLSGTAPLVTYTPAPDYHGSDSFTFLARDAALASNPATVSLTITSVNDTPVAAPISLRTDEDTPVSITLAGSDVDGDALAYTINTAPAHGTLAGTPPTLTYTPAPDAHGFDSFTYSMSDGVAVSAPAAVSIEVVAVNDRPVAVPQSLTVTEGEVLRIALSATDADGDTLTYAISTPPALGTLVLAPDSTPSSLAYLYTPPANTTGTVWFAFTASDASLTSEPAVVSIAVSNRNDAPVALPSVAALDEDTSVVIALAGTDVDGDALSYALATPPAHGLVTLAGHLATYTPSADYNGADAFTFTVTDNGAPVLTSAPATVTLTVRPVNDAPVAVAPAGLVTSEDTALVVDLVGVDADGDALTFTITTPPAHGVLTPVAGSPSRYTYAPAADCNGPDSFAYTVADATTTSAPANVSIQVSPVNDLPIGRAASYSVSEGQVLPIVLVATDVDGDALTYSITTPPALGTLLPASGSSSAGAAYVYTPPANTDATVTFAFTASDGFGVSTPAVVTIQVHNVNDAPVAQSQALTLSEDASLAVTLSATDPDGDALSYEVTVAPAHGTLTGVAPSLTYTPAVNYHGSDAFVFVARDSSLASAPASIALNVTSVNDAPVASDQSLSTPEDTSLAVVLTASDADNDALVLTILAAPAHGTLAPATGITNGYTYTPSANYHGADGFTYTATDPDGATVTASVHIDVTPVNDAPVAIAQSVTLSEDTTANITLSGADIDGDPLQFAITAQPQHGTLIGESPNLVYTPATNYNGPDSFTFKANDGALDSAAATVTLSVTPVNDAPVVSDGLTTLDEDTSTEITLTAFDADGDALTYIPTQPAHGTLTPITGARFTYTPAANYNGTDSFTFKVRDTASAESSSATFSLTIRPINDAPVAIAQSVQTNQDMSIIVTLTATDVDSATLSLFVSDGPQHGTLGTLTPTGDTTATITYTPAANYSGPDSFTFKARDAESESAPVTVSISVVIQNLSPVVDAGSDQLLRFYPTVEGKPRGKIVINNDEWVFTDRSFDPASPAQYQGAATFLKNLTHWITGGRPGRFLGYANVVPGSVEVIYTQAQLAQQMAALGHSWTVSQAPTLPLSEMMKYDAIFLGANIVDNQALITYVESGGAVYIGSGTRWTGDMPDEGVVWWNTFLNHFGLGYGVGYNGIVGSISVPPSEHPLLQGVNVLFNGNGTPVTVLDPTNPNTQSLWVGGGYTLLASYGYSGNTNTFYLTGSASDDHLTASQLTYQWTQTGGPAGLIMDSPAAPTTKVSYSMPGYYTFRLSVSDGVTTAYDDVSITLNTPPYVHAGFDQAIATAGTVQLAGTVTDDGFPVAPGVQLTWSAASAASGVSFSDPHVEDPTVTFSEPGIHVLKLSAFDGVETTSDFTEIRVGTTQTAEQPEGLVAWWPGNYYNRERVRRRDEAGLAVTYDVGKVGGAYTFDGSFGRYIRIPKVAGQTDVGSFADGFTMEFWVKIGNGAWKDIFAWADQTTVKASMFANYDNAGGFDLDFKVGATSWRIGHWNGQWQHVGVAYDRASGQMKMYLNGVLQRTLTVSAAQAADLAVCTAGELYLGGLPSNSFVGSLDELSFYDRELTQAELLAIYQAGSQGKNPIGSNQAPVVSAGPPQAVFAPGGQTTLLGAVSDDGLPGGPLDVAWTQLFGPATATLETPSLEHTAATFPVAGIYGFKLTASDGLFTRADTMEVRVGTTSTAELPGGLVAWWPGNYYNRESVRRRDEVGQGVTYTSGKVGGAYSFNGSGQFVKVSKVAGQTDVGNFADGFTMEFWVKIGSSNSAWKDIFAWADQTTVKASMFANYDNAGGFDLDFKVGATSWRIGHWNGQWQHVGVAYDRASGQMKMYLNGVLQRTLTVSAAQAADLAVCTAGELYLGGLPSNSYSGGLDELSFYDRALTQTELLAIYQADLEGKTPISDNLAPVVLAGPNQIVPTAGGATTLLGQVTDDGLPSGQLNLGWTQLFGPATATLANAGQQQTAATFPVAGIYGFKLTASDGLFTRTDTMEVRVGLTSPTEPPAGLVAWWPGNYYNRETVRRRDETGFGVNYTPGKVGGAYVFNGTGQFVYVPKIAGQTDVGNFADGFTMEFWVKIGSSNNAWKDIFAWADQTTVKASMFANYDNAGGFDLDFKVGATSWRIGHWNGQWQHVGVAYDRASGQMKMYLNGVLQRTLTVSAAQAADLAVCTAGELYLGGLPSNSYSGGLDELSFYDRALTQTELLAIFNKGADGKTPSPPNQPPVVNAGADRTAFTNSPLSLTGSATDDGLPNPPAALTYQWAKVSGPGSVTFTAATALSTQATFDVAGNYTLRLTAGDSALSGADEIVVTVTAPPNSAPVVNAGPDTSAYVGASLSLVGSATDDGLPNPPATLTYRWSKISGPGNVVFSAITSPVSNVTFDADGTYTLRLTANDSGLSGADDIVVTVTTPNSAPIANAGTDASTVTGAPLPLSGSAVDDGLPSPPAALTYAWSKVSGPGSVSFSSAAVAAPTATFDTAGTYVLRLTVSDSVLSASDDVTVTVTAPPSNPPSVAFYDPASGANVPASTYFEIAVHASDSDGSIAKVEFFNGATKLGQQTQSAAGDPTTYFWPFPGGLPVGTYTFTATATDNSGVSTTSAPITLNVITDPGVPTVAISTPAEDARISAPTVVTGVVSSPILASWSLDYRLKVADGETPNAWISSATGTSSVGTPATGTTPAAPGALGTFDPTLLLNGIYELRLTAIDTSGRRVTDGPITIIVEGNMKVGAFSLAFNDLTVPLAGIPITVTRTYDSRDKRVGDFGPGWRVAVANVRVQKNRDLGLGWYQTPQSGNGIQFYNVDPIGDRIVTVVMPDGETHRFRAGAYVKNRPGDPDDASFSVVVRQGLYKFYPLGDTTSTLEPLDASNQLYDHFWLDGTGNQDLYAGDYGNFDYIPYNPTRFRLTTKDGTVMLLDERLGLLELHDLTGNTLVIGRDAQNRVNTLTSTQNLPGGPIARSVSIHRDATIGRVDHITDLAGRTLDYLYDPQGRLASFTDRELNTTQFRYEKSDDPAHPFFSYLTKIIDPRGLPALRSEYDTDGRLKKQIDADGKETVFDRGIAAFGRFEKITDRLGHPTTFFYDDRGNITTKIDALGAQTTYAYYPDSDRVKLETDHYNNTKSMAYDARGNVTVQTIGASLTDDPANPTTGYTTRTVYNAFSAPTSITDPDGRVQSFVYDPVTQQLLTHTIGQLVSTASSEIVAATPATTTYTYHADGSLWTVTDALGNVTTTTYDYGFSDPAYPGAVKRVTTTVVDPAGSPGSDPTNAAATTLRTSYSYHDAQENLLATVTPRTLPDGTVESLPTRYTYDAENRLRFTVLPDGRIQETRYTSFVQTDKTLEWPVGTDLASLISAGPTGPTTGARVTSMTYNARGNVERTTLPDGTYTATGFDLEGRTVWSQDTRGYRTFTVYDEVGRPRFTIHPDADDGTFAAAPTAADDSRLANNPRSETRYDLVGRVRWMIDEGGATTETRYFADGTPNAGRREKLVQHLDSAELVTTYDYYPSGQVRSVTDPRGHTTGTRYDSHGRPVSTLLPATDEHPATATLTTYNPIGQRVAMTDQAGKVTRQRHDALGRLVEVRQYLDQSLAGSDADFTQAVTAAGIVSTRYSYDEAGHQRTQTDARGNATTYWTDVMGHRLKRILPDLTTENLDYDAWGNLWHRRDFSGKTTTYGYDTLRRLKTKTADATHPSLAYAHAIARVEYDYDASGAREAARTYNVSNTLLYTESTPRDERGHLDYKDASNGYLDYGYYANGQLQDVVSANPDGVNIGYRYDGLNRLAYVDDATHGVPARTTAYTYNANGSLETVSYANGVTHTYGYDALNRLRSLNVAQTAGLGAVLHAYEYKLTVSGHRHQVIEGAKTTTYNYDELYRLSGETITGAPSSQNGVVGYGLDKVGNRLNRTSSIAEITAQLGRTYNSRDQLAGDVYDLNGNTSSGRLSPLAPGLTPETSGTDVYDFEDRLVVRTKPDGSTINLSYDADGLRTQKTILNSGAQLVSTTHYLLDTNNLTGYAQVVEERTTDASGTTLKTYTYGSDLISASTTRSSLLTTRYFLYDGGGSVRELTDETGAITDRYTYDAFGVLLEHQGTSDNAYLYRGEQWDADLGLYYLRARFMNPDSGRFWNQDSYEGRNTDPASLHKYLYANADPVSSIDPSGHMTLAEEGIVGNIIGTMNNIVIPTLRVVNGAKKIADLYYLIRGVANLLQQGGIKTAIDDAIKESRGVIRKLTLDEIAEDLEMNLPVILQRAIPVWGPFILENINNIENFAVYLPHFGIKVPGGPFEIPIGLKMPGTDKPVKLVVGNSGGRRFRVTGAGIHFGRGIGLKQIWRMDFHAVHGIEASDQNSWRSGIFQYHVETP